VNPDGTSVYLATPSGISQFDVGAGGELSAKNPVTVAAGDDPADISVTPTRAPASVKVVGTTLVVTAVSGTRDKVVIAEESGDLRVTDLPGGGYSGSPLYSEPGAGCHSTDTYTAICPHSRRIRRIAVFGGDRGDQVTNSTAIPSSLSGQTGADLLVGGRRGDVLIGGPGADEMRGLNGNDLLKARDGASDKLIACGAASGDVAELDALPTDPSFTVFDCETIRRG
jgi:Ca2+-binding RTX toxin-like protein